MNLSDDIKSPMNRIFAQPKCDEQQKSRAIPGFKPRSMAIAIFTPSFFNPQSSKVLTRRFQLAPVQESPL
jgi:hypothetical protein